MSSHGKKTLFPLIAAVVLIGAHATIAQVLLVRELLVVFYGNELCLGVIFGAWLLGVAIGAGIGAKLTRKVENSLVVFLFLLLALCLLLPVQVSIIRLLRYIIHVPYGQQISILSLIWSSPLIIMPFSFVIGFIFPFSVSVFKGFTRGGATDIGAVYILESIGSLIGGVVFTFVLAPRAASYEIMAIFIAVVLTNLLILTFLTRTFPSRKVLLGTTISLLAVSLSLILSGGVSRLESFFVEKRWESFNPNIKLIESVDSRYQNIVLGKEHDQYSVYNNGQYAFAFPNLYEYGPMAHLILSEHPSPKRILLISGGIGGLISEMLKYPLEEVHYIELDPKLLEITRPYLSGEDRAALADERVTVFPVDGRYFVKTAKGKYKYDLVFINVPDPSTAALNRFYTREFFEEVKELLEPDGVLVASIGSAVVYLGEVVGSYTGSIYKTLLEVFPYVIVTPGQTNYYFASSEPDVITTDLDTLIARYNGRNIETTVFSQYHFLPYLEPGQVKFMKERLDSRKDVLPINTDSKPVTYFYNLLLWDQFSGGQLQGVLRSLGMLKLWYFLAAIGVFLVIRLSTTKFTHGNISREKKFNSIFAIATTGFAAIALEIILIFAFQNIYGYVYEMIGLIVALFMMGLAIGAYISNTVILKKQRDWLRILMYIVGGMVAYSLVIIPFIKWYPFLHAESAVLFMVLIIIPGVITGLEFPIASRIYLDEDRDSGRTAGLIDGADHLGAFAGAALTGIVLVPIMGVTGSCVIVAALNVASLVLLSALVIKMGTARKPS
ncbi:MAG: fused MFS/spermidine synthase [Candidatus Brocadiales bacterium]|nr:fused MFS/spermidine synthase [Candidatus Bathyanammoxibius amoris]